MLFILITVLFPEGKRVKLIQISFSFLPSASDFAALLMGEGGGGRGVAGVAPSFRRPYLYITCSDKYVAFLYL
jgi:hypothetical protein